MRDIRHSKKVKELKEGPRGGAFQRMINNMFRILRQMIEPGRSKHADKLINNGKPLLDKIYSFRTLELYQAVCCSFLIWAFLEYGCTKINEAREFIPMYLEMRIANGLSAWTVHLDASALAKLYQCSYLDFGVVLPNRKRGDIGKNIIDYDKLVYYEKKYPILAAFCRSCGLRRKEILMVRVQDIYLDTKGRVIVYVRQGKGGKKREVEALDDYPLRVRDMAIDEGRQYVFANIPTDVPIHVWRKIFAQNVYYLLERPIETLKIAQRYYCRSEMRGQIFDRWAMSEASKRLGHGRLGVMTTYLKPAIAEKDNNWMLADAA